MTPSGSGKTTPITRPSSAFRERLTRRGATRGDLRRDPELICRLIADSWHPRDFTGREADLRHAIRPDAVNGAPCVSPSPPVIPSQSIQGLQNTRMIYFVGVPREFSKDSPTKWFEQVDGCLRMMIRWLDRKSMICNFISDHITKPENRFLERQSNLKVLF